MAPILGPVAAEAADGPTAAQDKSHFGLLASKSATLPLCRCSSSSELESRRWAEDNDHNRPGRGLSGWTFCGLPDQVRAPLEPLENANEPKRLDSGGQS